MANWTNEVQPFGANHAPLLTAWASDGSGPIPVAADPATGRLLVNSSGGGAGTQYAEGATASPATGTAALGRYLTVAPTLTNGQMNMLQLDSSGNLKVTGSLSVGGTTDNSAFTAGTSTGTPSMGFYHSTIDTVTDGRAAAMAITPKRGLHVNLRDSSGNEIPTTTATTVNGSVIGLNSAPIGAGADYYPGYNVFSSGGGQIQTDPSGALVTRGAVLTDEGTFRVNFTGSSLFNTSGFNATFTSGGYTVTFASSIAGILSYGSFISLSADGGAAATIVVKVLSNTTVVLGAPYPGSSATGTFLYGNIGESIGTGGNITVASGQATITSGTTNGSQTLIYGPGGSVVSYYVESSFSISQRIANQDIYFGFEVTPFGTISQFARFHFTGTNNTQVITETGYNPTGAPSAAETETNTVTLPGGVNTASLQTYRMVQELDKIYFYINGNLIATHTRRLPEQKNYLYAGALFGIRTLNGTGATSTNVVVDYLFVRAYDRLDTNLVTASTANGANNSTTGTLIGAGMVGQYNSALPTVTSGSYYTSQIDSSGRQIVTTSTATGSAVPSSAFYQAGNPITSLPSAATAGNLTGLTTDKFGRQVIIQGTIRDLVGTQTTTISASTAETTIVTAAASVFNDLTALVVSNTSATATRVDFRDTTSGSILFSLYIPAGDVRGVSFTRPVPQTSVNTNWTAQSSASVTDLRVYAVFEKNK